MPTPDELTVRPFSSNDIAFFTQMATDDRITRFIGDGTPWTHETINTRTAAALSQRPVDEQGAARWFIATEHGHRVGLVVATRGEDVEIGYWVVAHCWGRGIAGAMVATALPIVYEVFHTDRLMARVDPLNAASVKILTRHGFFPAGHSDGLDRYIRDK